MAKRSEGEPNRAQGAETSRSLPAPIEHAKGFEATWDEFTRPGDACGSMSSFRASPPRAMSTSSRRSNRDRNVAGVKELKPDRCMPKDGV
jgi:hypothetical protein